MKTYTLRPNVSLPKVYLYRKPVDFRKGHRGLGAIIEQELAHDPFSGTLYVFINRQHNKLKALFWEDNGFVLYYKALAEEKFRWPREELTLLTITGEQMNWLLEGYDLSVMKAHKKLHYEVLC
jgi:transposase